MDISDAIESHIFLVRGSKVMLSTHLAELYQVEPKVLMQAVKRNLKRFPGDFIFRLSREESRILAVMILNEHSGLSLRSQIVTLEKGKHIKHLPYHHSLH
jgi:hypothetical protein